MDHVGERRGSEHRPGPGALARGTLPQPPKVCVEPRRCRIRRRRVRRRRILAGGAGFGGGGCGGASWRAYLCLLARWRRGPAAGGEEERGEGSTSWRACLLDGGEGWWARPGGDDRRRWQARRAQPGGDDRRRWPRPRLQGGRESTRPAVGSRRRGPRGISVAFREKRGPSRVTKRSAGDDFLAVAFQIIKLISRPFGGIILLFSLII